MVFQLLDENGRVIRETNQIANQSNFIKFMAINLDGSEGKNYILRVCRGSYKGNMYFTLNFADRIKTGSKSFSFNGKSTNMGNNPVTLNGKESTELRIDLTKETMIPRGAVVKRISTSSLQSPNQGGVRHMISTSLNGKWWVSKVSSSSSGMYEISLSDKF